MDFEQKALVRIRNRFSTKDSIVEVLAELKRQKVLGELRVGINANGGISFIEFLEKERVMGVSLDEP